MGKGRKGFHKEYSPPEEKFVVVVNAWGRSDNRQAYANNVAAWFEIMLRRCYSKEKPQIFRIWYQNTHETLIVELPETVTDLQPFLGVHPYSTFLVNAAGSDQCATLYEYHYKRFDHPERRNWREISPTYSRIPPNFPVRDPYPLPRDIELHLLVPPPPPPINVPYAIPVPIPAIPYNPPPPEPPSKSYTPESQSQSAGPNAGPSRVDPQTPPQQSSSRNARPSPPPSSHRLSTPPIPQPVPPPVQPPPQPPARSTPAFTPYVPPSHHPSHSILTEARARGHPPRGPDQQPGPIPMREEPQATIPKKVDLDPYEVEEAAVKQLSTPRLENPTLSQLNASIKSEDIHDIIKRDNDCVSTTGGGVMGEAGDDDDDDDYEPSAALLDALGDLGDLAGMLGSSEGIIEATSVSVSQSNQSGTQEPLSPVRIRVKPEPLDEDHLLAQVPTNPTQDRLVPHIQVKAEPMDVDRIRRPEASPTARPTTSWGRVKPEPMDEDHHLHAQQIWGPEASPTARPAAPVVQVKPEPMDGDYSLASTPTRGTPTPSSDRRRRSGAPEPYAHDDPRRQSPPKSRYSSDPRRAQHNNRNDQRHRRDSSSNSGTPGVSHSRPYRSPQTPWQRHDRREDRGSHPSNGSNSRKRVSEDWRHDRERREDSNKRPRTKMEPRD